MSEMKNNAVQALSLDELDQVGGGQSIPSATSILDTVAVNLKGNGATLDQALDSVSKMDFNSPLYMGMTPETAALHVRMKWEKY